MNAPKPLQGRLFLVPTPLDFGCAEQAPISEVLPTHTLACAARIQHWVCENAKSTRAFLKRVGETHSLIAPLPEQTITELPRHVHKKATTSPALMANRCWALPCRARCGLGERSGHACRGRPGQLGGAGRARSGHLCGAVGGSRVFAAGSRGQWPETDKILLLWGIYPKTRRSGRHASSSWSHWPSKPAKPSCG